MPHKDRKGLRTEEGKESSMWGGGHSQLRVRVVKVVGEKGLA